VFGITARLRAGRSEFVTPTGVRYSSPKRPFPLWNPLRTLFNARGSSSLEVKRPECNDDHSRPSGTELKNEWSCKYTPPIRLYVVDRDKFQRFNLHLKNIDLRALLSDVVKNKGPRIKKFRYFGTPHYPLSLVCQQHHAGWRSHYL